MAKKNAKSIIHSYGIYSKWERDSKALPKLLSVTNRIPNILDTEFGIVLKIVGGKGLKLNFTIFHPDFNNFKGEPEPPFTGEHFVNSNNWSFFLGDSIWEPVDDKTGTWTLEVRLGDLVIASKSFEIFNHLQ